MVGQLDAPARTVARVRAKRGAAVITLLDGPAKGTYMCKGAPLFVRATLDASDKGDVLDQVDDVALPVERIYIYERCGQASIVHMNMGRRKGTGFYARADYRYLPDVDGEALRDNAAMKAWAEAHRGLRP